MDENTKKRNNYNTDVINRLAQKYGVTDRFVRQSLKGDRDSETAETLKKEYHKMVKALDDKLQSL
jgi:hypothetical protein